MASWGLEYVICTCGCTNDATTFMKERLAILESVVLGVKVLWCSFDCILF